MTLLDSYPHPSSFPLVIKENDNGESAAEKKESNIEYLKEVEEGEWYSYTFPNLMFKLTEKLIISR